MIEAGIKTCQRVAHSQRARGDTDFFACDESLAHGPTRIHHPNAAAALGTPVREVVLTSPRHGVSVCDRTHPLPRGGPDLITLRNVPTARPTRYREVGLTSSRHGVSVCDRTHPLPRGGTDLTETRRECLRPVRALMLNQRTREEPDGSSVEPEPTTARLSSRRLQSYNIKSCIRVGIARHPIQAPVQTYKRDHADSDSTTVS
jgi:hypothetical protein